MIGVRWRALLAALPILIAPAILRAQAPPERELVGLTFQGNEAFSDKELGAAIVNKATTCKTFLFKFPLPLCPLTVWGIAHTRRHLSEKELPLDVYLFYTRGSPLAAKSSRNGAFGRMRGR